MKTHFTCTALLCLLTAAFILPTAAQADPCGMVPPIYTGQTPIARIGDQQTYVFHKDGVETFVIRPAFSGKVEDFGMLIPFPAPPALRKVPDNIFEQVQNAIDPPEVIVYAWGRYSGKGGSFGAGGKFQQNAKKSSDKLAINEVRVVRQEAVGMYEVAVLEAGSSAALRKWMDDHKYKFPNGMDEVCDDYVDDKWCFVAVKTQVGKKADADPRPGQRRTKSGLPTGSTFDGAVQAMAFRFPSEELVVPMRLSAFNEGDMHNIIYLLTDSPRRARFVPEEYVVRQVSGKQLLANLTQPLPIRVIGGTEADIPADWRRTSMPTERDPYLKNGAALDLFASDLLAVKTKQLSLEHEQSEKQLLAIGERLGLRGAEVDKLHRNSLADLQAETNKKAAEDIKGMTLTVIDGDLPRELVANRNITFASYQMPRNRNRPEVYNARQKGPQANQQGVRISGPLSPIKENTETQSAISSNNNLRLIFSAIGVSIICIGLAIAAIRLPLTK